ncbi:MAG TPA: hypothetical protein VNK91_06175 [Burkholderiaceae bacterium]|jgi:hypothetical protein|nr:hypothetical protein [Burkholderiaceae bacterium]
MSSKLQPTKHATSAPGDRLYDLSLRILMGVVSVGLVASVAFLTYRWLVPPRAPEVAVPVVEVGVKPAQASTPVPAAPPKAEVLMNPGKIFKCEVDGRVIFSEQACNAIAAKKGAR